MRHVKIESHLSSLALTLELKQCSRNQNGGRGASSRLVLHATADTEEFVIATDTVINRLRDTLDRFVK